MHLPSYVVFTPVDLRDVSAASLLSGQNLTIAIFGSGSAVGLKLSQQKLWQALHCKDGLRCSMNSALKTNRMHC